MWLYCGFVLCTLLCGFASTYPTLLAARLITGLFAGVVGSVTFAIVTDLFPLQMRGRVMGVIQASFGASSVLGIPFALYLSTRWSWNTPFFMTAAICALVGVMIHVGLRPVVAHLQLHPDRNPLHHLLHTLGQPRYLQGFATTGLLSIGGFMLMPFVSAFNVYNIGIPIRRLSLLYFITGLFSAACGPLIGRASDSIGKFRVFTAGCAIPIVMVVIYTHLGVTPLWVLIFISIILNVGIFSRMIASQALISCRSGAARSRLIHVHQLVVAVGCRWFRVRDRGPDRRSDQAGPPAALRCTGLHPGGHDTDHAKHDVFGINRRLEGGKASALPAALAAQTGVAVND